MSTEGNPDMMNEWTHEDLPVAFEDSKRPGQYWNPSSDLMRDLAVWLNAHHPKPANAPMGRAANNMLRETLANVERDCARLRRAHEIVEGERDQARRERDGAVQARNTALVLVSQAQDERDEALARAEAAENTLDQLRVTYGNLHDRANKLSDMLAEARTAPAVTKAGIEKVIDQTLEKLANGDWIPSHAAEAVWPLVSGADPAVFAVRESDVAKVEVRRASDGWYADGAWVAGVDETVEWVRDRAAEMVVYAARNEAVARAIEAEQAADPVEAKSRELADVMNQAIADERIEWHTAPAAVDALASRLARHVLGQEAGQ